MLFLVPTESASTYGFAYLRVAEHGLRSSVTQPCPLEDCSVFVFNIKGVSNHGSAPQFFLISLFERCTCARRCNKLVVTLTILLDYAPRTTYLTCTTLSVLFAENAERLMPFGWYLILAVATFFPI